MSRDVSCPSFLSFDWWSLWNMNYTGVDARIFLVNIEGQKKKSLLSSLTRSKCVMGVSEIDSNYSSLYRTYYFRHISDLYTPKTRTRVWSGRYQHLFLPIRMAMIRIFAHISRSQVCLFDMPGSTELFSKRVDVGVWVVCVCECVFVCVCVFQLVVITPWYWAYICRIFCMEFSGFVNGFPIVTQVPCINHLYLVTLYVGPFLANLCLFVDDNFKEIFPK